MQKTNKQTIKLIINKDDHGWRKMTHANENLRLRFSLCPSAAVAGRGANKANKSYIDRLITLVHQEW